MKMNFDDNELLEIMDSLSIAICGGFGDSNKKEAVLLRIKENLENKGFAFTDVD